MAHTPKGSFDDFIENLAKDFEMKSIVEASRDHTGRIDVGIATGLAMGRGFTSLEDTATFGAILGASGAFDQEDFSDDDRFTSDDDI